MNISDMKSRFSRPMPCSPDNTPPAATEHADDLLAGGVNSIHDTWLALVEHQQRMQVAVAGMEHVHHQQVVSLDDLVDLAQHFGQPATGNDGVVQVVVGLDPGDGPECVLASLPQQRSLGFVLGDAHGAGAVLLADVDDPLHVGLDPVLETGDLDEQDHRGVDRQTGVDVLLHGANAQLVHHLQRRWNHPGGDDRADGLGSVLDALEVHQHRANDRRILRQADAHLRGDTAHALAADERAAQVVSLRLTFLAAELHDLDRLGARLRDRGCARW